MSGQDQETSVEQEELLPEETLGDLKKGKAAAKTAFTKVRRFLLTIIHRPEVNREEIV